MNTTLQFEALFRRAKSMAGTLKEFSTEALESRVDAWIAALARQHRMPIVSRDIHFDRVKNIERLAW
jgi:predicted nucleic acid-binding protein